VFVFWHCAALPLNQASAFQEVLLAQRETFSEPLLR